MQEGPQPRVVLTSDRKIVCTRAMSVVSPVPSGLLLL